MSRSKSRKITTSNTTLNTSMMAMTIAKNKNMRDMDLHLSHQSYSYVNINFANVWNGQNIPSNAFSYPISAVTTTSAKTMAMMHTEAPFSTSINPHIRRSTSAPTLTIPSSLPAVVVMVFTVVVVVIIINWDVVCYITGPYPTSPTILARGKREWRPFQHTESSQIQCQILWKRPSYMLSLRPCNSSHCPTTPKISSRNFSCRGYQILKAAA